MYVCMYVCMCVCLYVCMYVCMYACMYVCKRCVRRRRTGTSALSELPVRLAAGKIYLSTNRKSHFLSLFLSLQCTMIKTFFHSPGSQLKKFMSACTKLPKNELNLRVSNAWSCRKTWHGCLSSSFLQKFQITPP